MTDKIVILSTASSEEEAGKLANLLVDRNLAACVNVLPRMIALGQIQPPASAAKPPEDATAKPR